MPSLRLLGIHDDTPDKLAVSGGFERAKPNQTNTYIKQQFWKKTSLWTPRILPSADWGSDQTSQCRGDLAAARRASAGESVKTRLQKGVMDGREESRL